MLKKTTAVLMCLLLLLSLCACGAEQEAISVDLTRGNTEETEPEEKPEEKPEEPEEPAEEEKVKLTAEEVYDAVAPSVVELHVYDADGNYISLGSGFFIDDSGTIATNYHVIEGGYSITAEISTGDSYDISYILAWDEDLDLALIQCEWNSPNYLSFSESAARTGETVYALGSSQGLTGTFSEGIVSTASREVEGKNCIQITAPISSGNSGGPLVNAYGEVLGINSMVYVEGQNLNFAIKISELDKLTLGEQISTAEFYNETYASTAAASYDDPAMVVYDIADYKEVESNDELNDADVVVSGTKMAGCVDAANGDVDLFAVWLEEGETVTFGLLNYYSEDDDYVMPCIVDLDANVLGTPEYDDDDEMYYVSYTAESAAYYIVVVMNFEDDYPYNTGCYYLLFTEVTPAQTAE